MSFRSARIKAGKKVSEVTEHMGCSDAAVYYWETGQNKPRAAALIKLASFYGCTVDELLAEEGEQTHEQGA